jgi:hypothetical protein
MPFNVNGQILTGLGAKMINSSPRRRGNPKGLIAGYHQDSYVGSGTTWHDISGYDRHMTLTSPSWDSLYGFASNSSTRFAIPGDANLYQYLGSGKPFSMFIRAYFTSASDLQGLFWSETGGKNFLIGGWYLGSGSNLVPRVDSIGTSMASWNPGQPPSNTGPSPSQANFNLTGGACQTVPMIGVTKDESNVFRFYGMNWANYDNQPPTLLWTSNAFSDWNLNYQTTPIIVMGKNTNDYFASGRLFSTYIFARALDVTEIKQLWYNEYLIINDQC